MGLVKIQEGLMKKFTCLWKLMCAVSLSAAIAWSQSSYTASVRGSVTDASGAAVSRRESHDYRDRTQRAALGHDRRCGTLRPDRAAARASTPLAWKRSGFKKYTQTDIPLAVQQQATFDIAMQVGELTTTVEVQSQSPLLNTTISTLGQVIENRYMMALPNIGRNPLSLLNLTPGVVGAAGALNPTQHQLRGQRHAQLHLGCAGGWRARQCDRAEQRRHGLEVDSLGGRGPGVQDADELLRRGICAVRRGRHQHGDQVRVPTSSTATATISCATPISTPTVGPRTGPDRRSLITIATSSERVFGGPIRKNKTFFFVTYEYTHSKSPSSQTATFPTLDQRNGDFSKTFFSDGRLITIYNPFDTFKDASGNLKRNPFPGNIIPQEHDRSGCAQGDEILPQAQPGPEPGHARQQLLRAGYR